MRLDWAFQARTAEARLQLIAKITDKKRALRSERSELVFQKLARSASAVVLEINCRRAEARREEETDQ
jgi:hypothetical protein